MIYTYIYTYIYVCITDRLYTDKLLNAGISGCAGKEHTRGALKLCRGKHQESPTKAENKANKLYYPEDNNNMVVDVHPEQKALKVLRLSKGPSWVIVTTL